jgi:tetratricopeptide (TPR) repeat protein
MPHLTEAQRDAFRKRSLSGADLLAASEHLRGCAECRAHLSPAAPQELLPRIGSPHLTYEEIEADIDSSSDPATHARVAEHLAVCASCRAEHHDLLTFRHGLAGRRAIRFRIPIAIAAAMVAAVGLSWWGLRRAPAPPPAPPVPAVAATPPAESLALLARVDPPPYRAPTLRATPSDAQRRFRDAMKFYTQGDYTAALPALESASALDPAAPGPRFYAGICRLVAGNASDAAAALQAVIALGDSPYLEKAGFFLAKARLRQNDIKGAVAALETTAALHGDYEEQARAILKQLKP